MDFVSARTVYDLNREPNLDELAAIVEQTIRIHTLDAELEFVFDPWAITNLVPLAEQVHDVPDAEQLRLVNRAIEETLTVDRASLPVALIHAELDLQDQGNRRRWKAGCDPRWSSRTSVALSEQDISIQQHQQAPNNST